MHLVIKLVSITILSLVYYRLIGICDFISDNPYNFGVMPQNRFFYSSLFNKT